MARGRALSSAPLASQRYLSKEDAWKAQLESLLGASFAHLLHSYNLRPSITIKFQIQYCEESCLIRIRNHSTVVPGPGPPRINKIHSPKLRRRIFLSVQSWSYCFFIRDFLLPSASHTTYTPSTHPRPRPYEQVFVVLPLMSKALGKKRLVSMMMN